MIEKLLLNNDKIYFLKSLNEDKTEGIYSIFMKKDSSDLVTCVFLEKHINNIKHYLDICGTKPRSAAHNKETGTISLELKPSFVEFHLENLEDWFLEEKISISEDMKIIE